MPLRGWYKIQWVPLKFSLISIMKFIHFIADCWGFNIMQRNLNVRQKQDMTKFWCWDLSTTWQSTRPPKLWLVQMYFKTNMSGGEEHLLCNTCFPVRALNCRITSWKYNYGLSFLFIKLWLWQLSLHFFQKVFSDFWCGCSNTRGRIVA